MTLRIRHFGTTLALALSLATTLQAQDEPKTPLGKKMAAMNTAMIAFPVSKSWTPSQSGLEIVDTSLLAWVIEAVDQLTATSKASTT